MKTLKQIKAKLRASKSTLEKEYGVTRLGIFGSFARSEQKKDSDVDLLVEFQTPPGLRFIHLANYLETLLAQKVDLLTPDAVKPNRLAYIMKDVIYV
jgi:predicted nucleotidyltransferase